MAKKVIIIGGVAAGASAAARLRRLDETAQIILLEKGPYISFANCGLPYHIGKIIKDRKELILQTPQDMGKRFKLDIRVLNEVVKIDKNKKIITVLNHETNMEYQENYDTLVLTPGSVPLKPPIEGINEEGIFTLWTLPDMDKIMTYMDKQQPKTAVVVGGGFIGIEVAENLHQRGLTVSMVEMLDQIMAPLDFDMAQILHKHVASNNVDLFLNDGVHSFQKKDEQIIVTLASGQIITTDMVILSIGVRPNSRLAKEAGLKLNDRGGIQVDEYLTTSDPHIYAAGDAIEVEHLVTKQKTMVPLAGPANKQGRIIGDNICGLKQKYMGSQGSCVVKVFDLSASTTGINEKDLARMGKQLHKDYEVTIIHPNHHAGYYPNAKILSLKLIFDHQGKILGAQAVGYEGVEKRIDVISTALRLQATIYDLAKLELCYAPPFSSGKDPVNMAGFSAENLLNGLVENILAKEINALENNTYVIVDVRDVDERKYGHIEDSIHIPIDDLRENLDKLPKDKMIIVHCAVGFRSYLGCRILLQNGFENVKNLAGGYTTYHFETKKHSKS